MERNAVNVGKDSVYYLDTQYPSFGKELIISLQQRFDELMGEQGKFHQKWLGMNEKELREFTRTKDLSELEKGRRMRVEFLTELIRFQIIESVQANVDVLTGKKTIEEARKRAELKVYHLGAALKKIEHALDSGEDPIPFCKQFKEVRADTTGKYEK